MINYRKRDIWETQCNRYDREPAGVPDECIPHQECHRGDDDKHLRRYHKHEPDSRRFPQRHLLRPLHHHWLCFYCVSSGIYLTFSLLFFFPFLFQKVLSVLWIAGFDWWQHAFVVHFIYFFLPFFFLSVKKISYLFVGLIKNMNQQLLSAQQKKKKLNFTL